MAEHHRLNAQHPPWGVARPPGLVHCTCTSAPWWHLRGAHESGHGMCAVYVRPAATPSTLPLPAAPAAAPRVHASPSPPSPAASHACNAAGPHQWHHAPLPLRARFAPRPTDDGDRADRSAGCGGAGKAQLCVRGCVDGWKHVKYAHEACEVCASCARVPARARTHPAAGSQSSAAPTRSSQPQWTTGQGRRRRRRPGRAPPRCPPSAPPAGPA